MEKIGAVENLTMCLVHGYNVLLSFENLNLNNKSANSGLVFNRLIIYYLISHLRSTPDEMPLSGHRCQCCGLQCDCLICISVLEEDVGNPDTLQLNIKFEIE